MKKRNLFPVLFAALMLFIFAAPANATILDENMCVNTMGGIWSSNTSPKMCNVSGSYNFSSVDVLDINSEVALNIFGILGNFGTINTNAGGIFENFGYIYNVGNINISDGGTLNNDGITHNISFYNGGTIFIACGGTFNGSDPVGNSVTYELCTGPNTPIGSNIQVSISPINVTFEHVTSSGNTTLEVIDGYGNERAGFMFLGRYYDVSTTAGFVGNVTVCLNYDVSLPLAEERNLIIMHLNGSNWEDVTMPGYPDTVNHVICGRVTSLSPFGVALPTGLVWSNMTVDSHGVTGQFTSLALDSSGKPHISYTSLFNIDLYYASWTGSGWNIETVDSAGDVGYFTSLALDSSGKPHISYNDNANDDLKYASRTESGWINETVDLEGVAGCIALDSSGKPHISYKASGYDGLKYASRTESGWINETVDSNWVSQYSSLVFDSSGNPHISYHDQISHTLKYASRTESGWNIETVDSAWYVGDYNSLALDSSGKPHISYFDYNNADLKYASWTESGWINETVDSAGYVGLRTSLALDSSGKSHISYYDYTNGALKYASRTGSGWNIETVDSAGYVGDYSSLAFDTSDNPHISYYNSTYGSLKYAFVNNTPSGSNIQVNPHPNLSINFEEVLDGGSTTVNVSTDNPGPGKASFRFLNTFYDIFTTAAYTGNVRVCLSYDASQIHGNEEPNLKIWHLNGSNWEDVTMPGYPETVNHVICGRVTSFSWFGVALPTGVHNVNKGTNYSTIQSAIDDADPGNEIQVDNGSYYENVNVNKQLSIRSTSGNPENTIIQALDTNDDVLEISADHVNISGITVKNASSWPKAGIYILNGVHHSDISNNKAVNNSIGIHLFYTGDNNTISLNIISDNIYGIYLINSNNNNVSSNNVTNNDYGIYLMLSSYNMLIGNNASNSVWDGIGFMSSVSNTLISNVISNNSYGIEINNAGDNLIYNNYLNNTNNFHLANAFYRNFWNITKREGTNIIDSPYFGGNFWANSLGTEISQTCIDVNNDGICDSPYVLDAYNNNIDYLPLTSLDTIILPPIRFINGTVKDKSTGNNLSGVTVSANSTLSTTSDATGFYSFAVTDGTYNLISTIDDIRFYTNTTSVSTFGKDVVILDIEMMNKPTGNITGSVTIA